MQNFVLHWCKMGARWRINRTVAQIHALLFLSPTPLTAEEIAQSLEVARSNVSNSLRELCKAGAFSASWMFRIIVDERKKTRSRPDAFDAPGR